MLDFSLHYLQILQTKLAGLNLTKILGPDEFYQKQILDSINPYLQSELFKQDVERKRLIVDVGFGGGFPILPLAKLLPEVNFIGIESKKKKVDAVKLIASELGLQNVTLVHSRLEDVLFDIPSSVTLKAVGTVNDYLPKINIETQDIKVFFYKGPSFIELEGGELEKTEKTWSFLENQEIKVPGTQQRFLVSFGAKNVPHRTAKSLVKLSELL